jgi:hypothetical protein
MQVDRFDDSVNDIDWAALRDLGFGAYFQAEAEYKKYLYRRHHRKRKASDMEPEPVGPSNSTRTHELGPSENDRVFQCTRTYGRKKRFDVQKLLHRLMTSQVWKFQSVTAGVGGVLGTGYRAAGSQPLTSRFVVAAFPDRSINLPVYCYRLTSPIGTQQFADATRIGSFSPQIQYRLRATQTAANAPWRYRWIPVNPTFNASSTLSTLNAAIYEETDADFEDTAYYHHWTEARVMFTAPTSTAATVEVRIVEFTEPEYAPPDAGYENNTTELVLSQNSGNLTLNDSARDRVATVFYDTWLHNRQSHPIVRNSRRQDMRGPPPFRTLQKFSTNLAPRTNTNTDSNPIQYIHIQKLNGSRWYASAQPDLSENGPGNGPLSTVYDEFPDRRQNNSGIFPKSDQGKWLMVSGFVRGSILNEPAATSLPLEPSFDIHIRAKFSSSFL